MILVHVANKMCGPAKQWLDCSLEEVTTWSDFKEKLAYSFPASRDQMDVHMTLAKKTKGRHEDYETYVYSMKNIARRGEIDDPSQIKYKIGYDVEIKRTQYTIDSKLKPRYLGPYKITKVKLCDRYEVEKIGLNEGPNNTSSSTDYMKAWPTFMSETGAQNADTDREEFDL